MASIFNRIPTLSALRHRNFRIYWVGLLVAVIGWQMLTFTQLWLVYELTNSSVYLGLAGGINGTTTIVLSIFGGVYADRLDRRKLIIISSISMAVLAFALATLTLLNLVNIWHLLILTALTGAASAFDNPARQAMLPHLIEDHKDLNNAVALAASVWSGTRIVGPALAGGLIVAYGPAVCFYITAAAYTAMILSLLKLRLTKVAAPLSRASVLSEFAEGWRFVLKDAIFLTLISMTFLNSVFGMSFIYLMPIFAKDILDIGPTGYGFLMTAYGVGGVTGVIMVASIGHIVPRGKMLLMGCIIFGVLLAAFAASRLFSVSMVLIALMGFFNSLYMTNVQTTLQALVPDALRGRVMGIYGLTWSLLPLGGMQAGFVAAAFGAPWAIAVGGLVISGFVLLVMIFSANVRHLK